MKGRFTFNAGEKEKLLNLLAFLGKDISSLKELDINHAFLWYELRWDSNAINNRYFFEQHLPEMRENPRTIRIYSEKYRVFFQAKTALLYTKKGLLELKIE